MEPFIRAIARRARGKIKIGMGDLASNLKRFVAAGAEGARMRHEAMLSIGKSSNDLSGDNNSLARVARRLMLRRGTAP